MLTYPKSGIGYPYGGRLRAFSHRGFECRKGGLFSGKAELPICFSLQGGKVIEFGWIFGFFFAFHTIKGNALTITGFAQSFCRLNVLELFAGERETATIKLYRVKRLRLKY